MEQTLPPSTTAEKPEAGQKGKMNIRRTVIIAAGALLAVILLIVIITLVIAITADPEQASGTVRLIRDLIVIFVALEVSLIILALAVLILQVAKLVNLLQSEVKPILENTQDAAKTAQTTAQFVSQNVTEPVVKTGAFITAAGAFSKELFGIRKAVRRTKQKAQK